MDKKVAKMAAVDASRWAFAEMFFGQGAGTKRKLLTAEITHKFSTIPGYESAYFKAYHNQDFAKHALNAAKERQKLDRHNVVGKNVKALVRGDYRRRAPGLVVLGLAGAYAHQQGYDKLAWTKAKTEYAKAHAVWLNSQFRRDVKRVQRETRARHASG